MAVNSSYYDHHFPINGRYPTAVDVISLYGSGSAALPKQATSTSPAESVVTPYAPLDSYVNADGEVINCLHENIGSYAVAFVGTSGVQMGWLASQADMLAEDWQIVNE